MSGRWAMVLILLLAAAARWWGLAYDLPAIYHPDEPGYVVRSQEILRTGDLNPHFFNYPSLFFYANSAVALPYSWLAGTPLDEEGRPLPVVSELAMGVTVARDAGLILLGRALSAGLGLAAVAMIYVAGRWLREPLWGRGRRPLLVGLTAALLLALSSTNVLNNRAIAPDTFVTFFVLAAFTAALLVLHKGRTRDYLLAGLLSGLAISSKYNGGLILLVVVAAHLLHRQVDGRSWSRLLLAGVAAGLAFILTSPFAVLDFPKFWADISFEAGHYASGHQGMEGDTLAWYAAYLWQRYAAVLILAAIGLLAGIRSRSREMLLLALFPLLYFAFISRFAVRNDRTIMVLTPFLFLMAAAGLAAVLGVVDRRWPGRQRALLGLAGLLLLLLLAWPAARTVRIGRALSQVDSRRTAALWIDENLPPGSTVALESYAPYVSPQAYEVQGLYRLIDRDPAWFQDEGIDYFIAGDWMFGRFFDDPQRYAAEVARYEALFSRFTLLHQFDDGGYEVRIYRVE